MLADNPSTIRNAEGKFFHLNGKRKGTCPHCSRTLRLRAGDRLPIHNTADKDS